MNNQGNHVTLCSYPGNPHHHIYERLESLQETISQLLVRGTTKGRWVTDIPPSWISGELSKGVTLETACIWHSMRRIVQFKEMCDYIATGNKYVFATETRLQASLNPHLQLEHPQITEWSAAHSSIGGYPLDRDFSDKHIAQLNVFASCIQFIDEEDGIEIFIKNQSQNYFSQKKENIILFIKAQNRYFGLNNKPDIEQLRRALHTEWSNENQKKDKEKIASWIRNNYALVRSQRQQIDDYPRLVKKKWDDFPKNDSTSSSVNVWIEQQTQVINTMKELLTQIEENFTRLQTTNDCSSDELLDLALVMLQYDNLRISVLDSTVNKILDKKWIDTEEFIGLISSDPLFPYALKVHHRLDSLPKKIKQSGEFLRLSPLAQILFTFSPSQSTMPLNSILAWEQSTALVLPHHEVNRGIDAQIEKILRPFVIKLWRSIFLEQITSEQAVELFRIRILAILIEIRTTVRMSKAKSDSLSSIDQMKTSSSSSSPGKKKTSPPEKARLKDNLTKVPAKVSTSVYRALFSNPEGHSLVPKLDALEKSDVRINFEYWTLIRRELLELFIDPNASQAEKDKMLTSVESTGLDVTPCSRAVHVIAHFNALFLQNAPVYKSNVENSLRLMYTPTRDLDVDGAQKILQVSGISVHNKCDENIFLVIVDAMIKGVNRNITPKIDAPATPTLDIKICTFCRQYFSGLRSQGPSPLSIPEVDDDLKLP